MATEVDSSLRPEALREIEFALRRKLEGFDLSDAFIERSIDDAIQKGLVEYLRARERGEEIQNRIGFVVRAAFLRAIDELRREARMGDGAAVEAMIDTGRIAAPGAEEAAIAELQAQEVREAVGQLSPEEQQVLRLHYFEELSAEASAEALYCSERTYRRRLGKALRRLSDLLGTPVPEPGSEPAIEIGLAAWVALRGAQVALSQAPLEHLAAMVEGLHARMAWALDRARELAGRTAGGGEKLTAIASSGPGRAVGTCVAACVLAVGGAELAGVGQGGGDRHPAPAHRADRHKEAGRSPRPQRLVVASPVPTPRPTPASRSESRSSQSQTPTSSGSSTGQREREATEAVRSQQPESAVVEEAPAPEAAPESSGSTSSGSSPTQVANEQFGP